LASATPAEEPNQIIEPPKPTAKAKKPQSCPPCLRANAVSGMLSKTAETKPRPSAVCHDAAGSFSTGIIEAQVTNESRKTVPLKVSGSTPQSGCRKGTANRMAAHTAKPMTGHSSNTSG
jgi:hypothetical protein